MANPDYLAAEARARVEIDRQLADCGWLVQDRAAMNLSAGPGVAVREFVMAPGDGRADYLLFVDGAAVGAVEAKPAGTTLAGVEAQSAKYAAGPPANLPRIADPLPFLYEATGAETMFADGFDPDPRAVRLHDSHADDIVLICREEFGRGNDFAVKITYKTTAEPGQDPAMQADSWE